MSTQDLTNPWFDTIPGPRLAKIVEEKGDQIKDRYHTDDVYFGIWLHAVNTVVRRRVFLSFDDLEDWGYRDAYDGGMSPKDAALEMLDDNGYESEGL